MDGSWYSLIPLGVVNVLFLFTVVIFRGVYQKSDRLKSVEERHASHLLNRWMREYWYWLTGPVTRFFIALKLTPNSITFIGVLISCIAAYFFSVGEFGWGGWFMILSATFDMFDGHVARATGQVTDSGAYFDSVMDRVAEGVVLFGLALFYRNGWGLWLVIAALVGSFLVSYTKARGDASGAVYSGGSMQRPERIVYMGVGAVFVPLIAWMISVVSPFKPVASLLYLLPLTFVAIMTWVTAFQRIFNVMKILDQKKALLKKAGNF